MKDETRKFLQFNGQSIYFLANDGKWWIAVKPICEALDIQYEHQFKTIKAHPILSELLCEHTIVAADNKLRKMVCLPEFGLYGWLLETNSKSPDFIDYKWECYQVLYQHFKGGATSREELLEIKEKARLNKAKYRAKLQNSEDFKAFAQAEKDEQDAISRLKKQDAELVKEQMPIWRQNY